MSLLFGIGFAKLTFPLSVIRPPEMPEIRFEAKDSTVAVLDGYCSATGKCRTAFINGLPSKQLDLLQ